MCLSVGAAINLLYYAPVHSLHLLLSNPIVGGKAQHMPMANGRFMMNAVSNDKAYYADTLLKQTFNPL
jgi:hypothetical protein